MIRKYVDHGNNGLYFTEQSTKNYSYQKKDPELVYEAVEGKNMAAGSIIKKLSNIINDGSKDQNKKIRNLFVESVKELCEDNLILHTNILRNIILNKFFQKTYTNDFWEHKDMSDTFLKICERIYNKKQYNFVVFINENNRQIIRTFCDDKYHGYIDKMFCNRHCKITVENISSYDLVKWSNDIMGLSREKNDFLSNLNRIVEKLLITPGILFKKNKNGIPFGLWVASHFINACDVFSENLQKIGQILFENNDIFTGRIIF